MIHFLLAAGICPNNGLNPTWSLLREKIGSDWEDFITRQLETKCTIPDISEYDNRPMYPHEISLSLLDFAFLSESLGIKSSKIRKFLERVQENVPRKRLRVKIVIDSASKQSGECDKRTA